MYILVFIRLLLVCNLLHIGEPSKCITDVNDKSLKVRSRWSPWSEWGPCTRSCGIGIQQRNRTCLSTKRRRRKSCAGSSSAARICNTQDCQGKTGDILSDQCTAFNNRTFAGKTYTWLPFLHLGRECSLHCRPQGERFFAELSPTADDGTPCGKNSYCYKGQCLEAGCNNLLGLEGKTDCEMCDKNPSYRRIAGIYTRPNLVYGYNYVTTIPSTALNITISQLKTSNNHLALRKSDGSYIINGNWNINQPGQYADCGTTFTYRREPNSSNLIKEYIMSPGPLKEPIQLMLITVQVNSGVKYEYNVLNSDSVQTNMLDSSNDAAFQSKNTFVQHRVHHGRNDSINNINAEEPFMSKRRHRKRHLSWKPCFKSCGDGIFRSLICFRQSNEMIVPDSRCSSLEKPFQDDHRCNATQICLPEWVPSEWSSCSTTCGEGVQRRDVICKKFTSAGYLIPVNSEVCSASSTPISVQTCHLKPCDTDYNLIESWEIGLWSKCSTPCGPGIRTRQVICRSSLCPTNTAPPSKEPCNNACKTEVGIWLASPWELECSESCGSGWQMRNIFCYGTSDCNKNDRPETYRSCSSDESCSGQWFEGPWQKCSGICGTGEKRRDVLCIAKVHNQFVVVPDNNCKPDKKPDSVQRCQLPKCSPTWYTTDWSTCSSSCGGGIQYREVFCIEDNNQSSSCSVEEKPSTSQDCNTHSCTNSIEGTGCEDNHKYCQTAVVQARLCLYSYYKNLCCQSCYNRV